MHSIHGEQAYLKFNCTVEILVPISEFRYLLSLQAQESADNLWYYGQSTHPLNVIPLKHHPRLSELV